MTLELIANAIRSEREARSRQSELRLLYAQDRSESRLQARLRLGRGVNGGRAAIAGARPVSSTHN